MGVILTGILIFWGDKHLTTVVRTMIAGFLNILNLLRISLAQLMTEKKNDKVC